MPEAQRSHAYCLGCLNSIHNIIIIIRVKIKSFYHKVMLYIYERGSFSSWSRTVLTNSDGCHETCWYALPTFHIHDLYKTIYFNTNCLSAVQSTVRYCFHEKYCHIAMRHKSENLERGRKGGAGRQWQKWQNSWQLLCWWQYQRVVKLVGALPTMAVNLSHL